MLTLQTVFSHEAGHLAALGWTLRLRSGQALEAAVPTFLRGDRPPHDLRSSDKLRGLLGFAEGEFTGYGAAFVGGLDQDGGVAQSGFLDFYGNFRGASVAGNGLSVDGRLRWGFRLR